MKALSKSKPFYQVCITNFRKQYKDVIELKTLKLTSNNKICGGEWINSQGTICIADSIDAVSTVIIKD